MQCPSSPDSIARRPSDGSPSARVPKFRGGWPPTPQAGPPPASRVGHQLDLPAPQQRGQFHNYRRQSQSRRRLSPPKSDLRGSARQHECGHCQGRCGISHAEPEDALGLHDVIEPERLESSARLPERSGETGRLEARERPAPTAAPSPSNPRRTNNGPRTAIAAHTPIAPPVASTTRLSDSASQ